jgi:phage-related minor tail protein
MKGNQTGVMGEAGPEGILPLKKDKSGKLGVRAEMSGSQGGSTVINQTFNIDATNNDAAKDVNSFLAATLAMSINIERVKSENEALPLTTKSTRPSDMLPTISFIDSCTDPFVSAISDFISCIALLKLPVKFCTVAKNNKDERRRQRMDTRPSNCRRNVRKQARGVGKCHGGSTPKKGR